MLKISLHPACKDLHTQPLLPNGAVFQLFRWKISLLTVVHCGSSVNMLAATAGSGCGSTVSVFFSVTGLLLILLTHAACSCGHCGSTVSAFLL